jgi:hypothetical protein
MIEIARAIANRVADHVRAQVRTLSGPEDEYRAVFNGPPTPLLDAVFDLLAEGGGIEVTGLSARVPVSHACREPYRCNATARNIRALQCRPPNDATQFDGAWVQDLCRAVAPGDARKPDANVHAIGVRFDESGAMAPIQTLHYGGRTLLSKTSLKRHFPAQALSDRGLESAKQLAHPRRAIGGIA